MTRLKPVIFGCDGVLIDSEPVSRRLPPHVVRKPAQLPPLFPAAMPGGAA